MNYTVMSKRKLLKLVQDGRVNGWDDPRMPTLCGLRRRGFTPQAILDFANRIGVAKADSVIDVALLEACLRDDLNKRATRRLAVLRPLKLVIDNYPADQVEDLVVANHPDDPSAGTRTLKFSKELYIEQEDFQEVPAPKYYRLFPGNEVRLRSGYIVKCVSVVKNDQGEVIEVHCTYDPETRGGNAPDGRKIKSTIHWVSAAHAVDAEVRLYDRLFNRPDPEAGEGYIEYINENSLTVLSNCKVEASLATTQPGDRFQFERQGFFCADLDSRPEKLVFNLAVALRDTWAKIESKQK
jgi:glutaminyl-tRNA synthetase